MYQDIAFSRWRLCMDAVQQQKTAMFSFLKDLESVCIAFIVPMDVTYKLLVQTLH